MTKSHIKMASTTSHIAEQCVSTNKGKFCMAGVQKQGGMKMKFENCKEYCSLKNNKENIRKLMKEFDCEASGKSNLIRPLVTDENGRFDEKKAEKLITELVEDMDRYGYRYKMWLGHITAENALPEQKSFCRYVRMYLYLAIRMSLLDFSQYGFLMDNLPNGSFDNLLSGCIDFESNNDKDTLLFEYIVDGWIGDAGIISWCVFAFDYSHPDNKPDWMSDKVYKRMQEIEEEMLEDLDSNDMEELNDMEDMEDVEDLGDMDDFDIDDIDIVEPIYDNLDADEFVDEGFLQDGHDADESKNIVSVCDQMEDSDKICSCFASFLDMIYSDEVPYSYLSQMRKAVEGMLDTYMWDHGLSIYSSMDSLKRSKLYLEKAAEKTAYLNAQRKNRL